MLRCVVMCIMLCSDAIVMLKLLGNFGEPCNELRLDILVNAPVAMGFCYDFC